MVHKTKISFEKDVACESCGGRGMTVFEGKNKTTLFCRKCGYTMSYIGGKRVD